MSPFHKASLLLLICFSILILEKPAAQSRLSKRQLKKAFKEFVNDTLFKHAQLSFQLTEFNANKPLLHFNEDKALIPASILKIIPSALLLDAVGPDFQFRTAVYLVGEKQDEGVFNGHIHIVGRGDPSFCSPYLQESISLDSVADLMGGLLSAKGIHTITGGIRIDQSYIMDQPENPEWLYYDLGNYYGSGCQSFNFNENEIEIKLAAAIENGETCEIIRELPDIGSQSFISEVVGIASSASPEIFVLGNSMARQKIIKGRWKCCIIDSIAIRAAMHDPAAYFTRLLSMKLMAKGIRILEYPSVVKKDTLSQQNKPELLCEWLSPNLHRLVQRALYKSVNLYCESFLHELGRIWLNNTSRDSVVRAIDDSLTRNVFANPGFEIEDGSGLSPKNFISASNMDKFLAKYKYYNGEAPLWKCVPDIHNTGVLRKYLQPKHDVKKALHLKSGSMERVRSYAGYLVADQKIVATICIIVNNYPGKSENLQKHIARFLDKVMLTKFD